MLSSSNLSAGPERTPHGSPLRQHDGGVIYKSPRRAHLKTPFRDGKAPLGVRIHWGQHMCLACWIKEQICCLGATSPLKSECSTHKWFRKSVRSLARQRSTASPQKTTLTAKRIFRRARMCWMAHKWPNFLLYAFPPIILTRATVVCELKNAGRWKPLCYRL